MTGFIHFKDVGNASVGDHQSVLASSGTRTLQKRQAIMNQPSLTSTYRLLRTWNECSLDRTLEKDGYRWISYISKVGTGVISP